MTKDQSKNGKKITEKSTANYEDKKKETPIERFQRKLMMLLAEHYSECLSENIRRGIAAKKLRNENSNI